MTDLESLQLKTYYAQLHAANVRGSNALLSRMVSCHGEIGPVVVVEVQPMIAEPELPPAPVDPKWIKMIEEMPDPKGPSVKEIKLCVAHHFNVSPQDLESPRKYAKIVLPRQVAFYLARKLTTRSFPEIGRKFGGRDHSTILWGAKVIAKRITSDVKLAATILQLEEQLQ